MTRFGPQLGPQLLQRLRSGGTRSPGASLGSRCVAGVEAVLWACSLAALGLAAWMVLDAQIYQSRARETLAELAEHGGREDASAGVIAAGAPIARIEIPRLDLEAVIAEGTSGRTLQRAVGRLDGSARPGQAGNIVLAGHRDTFFRPLKTIQVGDVVYLESSAGRDVFTVEWTQVVEPSDIEVTAATDYPAITLVTCYPFNYIGNAPLRFVVRARRNDAEPSDSWPNTVRTVARPARSESSHGFGSLAPGR